MNVPVIVSHVLRGGTLAVIRGSATANERRDNANANSFQYTDINAQK